MLPKTEEDRCMRCGKLFSCCRCRMGESLPTCPICGNPVNHCRCGSGWNRENNDLYNLLMENDNERDISFECYACPNFIIFNSEDPNRIPRTVEKVNECFRAMRNFYWDLMDNAKIPMSRESSGERHEVDAPLTDEDKEYLTHLLHLNEYIHQLLEPHFICEDIPKDVYTHNYMNEYEHFNRYIEALKNTPNLANLNLGYYYDAMTNLFYAVEACFGDYIKRKADN